MQALENENLNIEISSETDVYIKQEKNKVEIHLLGTKKRTITVHSGKVKEGNEMTKELMPGDYLEF